MEAFIPFGLKKICHMNIRILKVIPRLYKFKPDIIFLSAGFDGHENEIINQKNIFLNEFNYNFITQQIERESNKYYENGKCVKECSIGYEAIKIIIDDNLEDYYCNYCKDYGKYYYKNQCYNECPLERHLNNSNN